MVDFKQKLKDKRQALALEVLDGERCSAYRRAALDKAIDALLPKLTTMDRGIIENRRDDIKFLRQAKAFLKPFIRNAGKYELGRK